MELSGCDIESAIRLQMGTGYGCVHQTGPDDVLKHVILWQKLWM